MGQIRWQVPPQVSQLGQNTYVGRKEDPSDADRLRTLVIISSRVLPF